MKSKRGEASLRVRKFLDKHPDASPKEVAIQFQRYGVTANLVSNIKFRIRSGKLPGVVAPKPSSTPSSDDLLAAARVLRLFGSLRAAKEGLELVEELSRMAGHAVSSRNGNGKDSKKKKQTPVSAPADTPEAIDGEA